MKPTLAQLFLAFLKLGCTSFGGPIAHLSYFQKYFVEKHQWLTLDEYTELVSLAQILPGPASSQVGMSIGYRTHGLLGSIVAWLAFTTPSAAILTTIALQLPGLSSSTLRQFTELTLLIAVIFVSDAVITMVNAHVKSWPSALLALSTALASITVVHQLTAPVIIISLIVFLALKNRMSSFNSLTLRALPKSTLICLSILTVVMLIAVMQPYFLMKFFVPGTLVFGGGHVVLPLLHSTFVPPLTNDQFLSGYGAAQAVPGPLFTISAFIGALAFPSAPINGAVAATFIIFTPSFLMIWAAMPLLNSISNETKEFFKPINAAVTGILIGALVNPVILHANLDLFKTGTAVLGVIALRSKCIQPVALIALFGITFALIEILVRR